MSTAKSSQGFPDCREFLDRALSSKKGWRVRFEKHGAAVNFRVRCYAARNRERAFNIKYYPKEEIMHGKTAWDGIVLLKREVEGGWEIIAAKDGGALLDMQATWQGPVE